MEKEEKLLIEIRDLKKVMSDLNDTLRNYSFYANWKEMQQAYAIVNKKIRLMIFEQELLEEKYNEIQDMIAELPEVVLANICTSLNLNSGEISQRAEKHLLTNSECMNLYQEIKKL